MQYQDYQWRQLINNWINSVESAEWEQLFHFQELWQVTCYVISAVLELAPVLFNNLILYLCSFVTIIIYGIIVVEVENKMLRFVLLTP